MFSETQTRLKSRQRYQRDVNTKTPVPPPVVERLLEDHELARADRCCSGGYNEAFVLRCWTGYTPPY